MNSDKKDVIALDVMGADSPMIEIIRGAAIAANDLGEEHQITLVGQTKLIKKSLAKLKIIPANISIQEAPAVVPMDLAPTEALRMRDSSIAVGIGMVKSGAAQAFVSPGNTGAVMAGSLVMLGRIEGVIRPAIAIAFPSAKEKPVLVLDIGANADCKPSYLSQFAVMGAVYYAAMLGNKNPSVGLLSIGEERSKGNELIKAARELLANSKVNFKGNIEGRDILEGDVDVVVTDGFTGNILLKFYESIQPMMVGEVIRQIRSNIFSRFGLWLMLPFMNRMRTRYDYAQAGGAPLLGVNGNVVISHGASNELAITNAVKQAHRMIIGKMQEKVRTELITNHFGQGNGKEDKS